MSAIALRGSCVVRHPPTNSLKLLYLADTALSMIHDGFGRTAFGK
jgi:hypothetical protein